MTMTCFAFRKNNHDLKPANVDICLTYISDQENASSWYKSKFLLKSSIFFNQKYEIFFTHQHAREYHCDRKIYEILLYYHYNFKDVVNPPSAAATFSLQISENSIFELHALNEIF